METVKEREELMVISEQGFGKRTKLAEYSRQSRGGKGSLTLKVTPKTGNLVAIKVVKPGDELMIITKEGIIIRIDAADTSLLGRNTQGVTLIKLHKNDQVVAVAKVISKDDDV